MNPEDPSDPLKQIAAMLVNREKWRERMEEITDKGSDSIESAVLVDLWRDLGDNTATYYEAMGLVEGFMTSLKTVRDKLSPESKAAIHTLKALASCIYCDAMMASIILDERDKHEQATS